MNRPFPSALQLSSESAVERLLAEQAVNTDIFLLAVRHLAALIDGLQFPLGSPAHRYDLGDITATLADWQIPRDPEHLRDDAEDAVITRLSGEV